jgi:hypothetical protein
MRVAQLRSGFFEFFAPRQGWAETGSQLRRDPIVSGRSERFASNLRRLHSHFHAAVFEYHCRVKGIYPFTAFILCDNVCSTLDSEPADLVGMLICMPRSFFGSRQFTCGSMSESTRSGSVSGSNIAMNQASRPGLKG